jgi:DEAD/DEAH box helicase domain-containing protein
MCDPQDIHVVPQVKAVHNEKPTIFFYDRYPGGVGLSEKIYDGMEIIIKESKEMIARCNCHQGCPSCIGTDPTAETAKIDCLKILDMFQYVIGKGRVS